MLINNENIKFQNLFLATFLNLCLLYYYRITKEVLKRVPNLIILDSLDIV